MLVLMLLVLLSVVCETFLLCSKFLPLILETLTEEFGALLDFSVLLVATERKEDFDCTCRRGEREGMGGGGGGGGGGGTGNLDNEGIGSTYSTSETVDRFLRIGLRTGILACCCCTMPSGCLNPLTSR